MLKGKRSSLAEGDPAPLWTRCLVWVSCAVKHQETVHRVSGIKKNKTQAASGGEQVHPQAPLHIYVRYS